MTAPTVSNGASRTRRSGSATRSARRAGLGFVLPFFVLFLSMVVVPLGYAAYLSLFETRLIGGESFVGLEQYAKALTDPLLLEGIGRVAVFFLIQVPLMLAIALIIALILDSGMLRLAKVFRLGVFLPYAVPSVIAALMWGYLYGDQFGPLAQLAAAVGLPAPNFLSQGNVLGAIANIVTWEFAGYNMIIMYAALRAIPTELYEAAAVDGAGAFRVAWSIKLPALRPAIMVCLIFSVIGSFQLFNEPNLLQNLAPSSIDSAFTPNLYAYSLAFTGQNVNYAAAVSFLLGAVIFIVSYVAQSAGRRKAEK
ncbi:sugar ABC transporter permease [Microbacterium sp. ARD31]|uniref:carbohydrate ABC transporter permease n=1 Tax=Microbacterium sp. ARD31 TaxID=2962576 RepID=UPI002881107C|nr:sugar ABC transporter permease [Microbacterium sp. ARD31]MDT0186071.1 sugar ABC transporter permease [Microbacterium sp. ARD31]